MPRLQLTMKTITKFALTLGISLAAAFSASADIIPNFSSVTASGSDFRWNYSTTVTQDEEIVGGSSYFTIYDFKGFVPGSNSQPAGWTFSSSLTGVTPATVLPKDNPAIPNLTWKYTGATKVGAFNAGLFSALSATNLLSPNGAFTAQATRAPGTPDAGKAIDNVGLISVPVPEMSALMPIVMVGVLGLASFAITAFRRRQIAI